MATHNKIVLAATMFTEAHARYVEAAGDIDYVTSILLSGAVMGIVSPLFKEQGGHTSHELLARIERHFAEPDTPPAHEGMFRAVYNGLKHAGNRNKALTPSADLELETDLRAEAAQMLEDARADFRYITVSKAVRDQLPAKFLDLVASGATRRLGQVLVREGSLPKVGRGLALNCRGVRSFARHR